MHCQPLLAGAFRYASARLPGGFGISACKYRFLEGDINAKVGNEHGLGGDDCTDKHSGRGYG